MFPVLLFITFKVLTKELFDHCEGFQHSTEIISGLRPFKPRFDKDTAAVVNHLPARLCLLESYET